MKADVKMGKIAVDIVLLPEESMTEAVISANGELVLRFGSEIVLNRESCLPHISLAMGCIKESDVEEIGGVLGKAASAKRLGFLRAVGTHIGTNSVGEKVSSIEIERSEELQRLHEEIMEAMGPYFRYEVSREMIWGGGEVAESTLKWIKDYAEKSSFEKFFPHITVGYGEAKKGSFPVEFAASSLALCHLGNHCTCREVLLSIEI
ncbi:MAG: 2'-5' RNA ligase family protein [Planctomycetota bacterium]